MTARAEQTKNRILEAAELAFAEKGLHGARVDEIAARATVNKRMIYAHFQSKEGLYIAVLERVYARLSAWEVPFLERADTDAENAIRALIQSYFAFLCENPTFVQIVMWENLNKAAYLRQSAVGEIKAHSFRVLRKYLQTGAKNGVFRADIDVEETLLSLNLLCFSYFSNIHTFTQLTQTDLAARAQIDRRSVHVADLLLKYLK